MKKLMAIFCCYLYMHSIAQAPLDVKLNAPGSAGEKVLVKALTAIVNREGNKKTPVRRINLAAFEYP